MLPVPQTAPFSFSRISSPVIASGFLLSMTQAVGDSSGDASVTRSSGPGPASRESTK